MKLITAELAYFFRQPQSRQNVRSLLKYVLFLCAVILIFSLLFHFIKLYVENERHSWMTGLYWTLTVMSTLGFGDITFDSDIGRLFSIVVLLSGLVLLLIMLPFAFIRYFYAPWLEAQIHLQVPREAPAGMKDHVILCSHDTIASGLIRKLSFNRIPYLVIEPDPVKAANLRAEGVSAVTGDVDSRLTYERLRVREACLVVANLEDTINTNITLTVREESPDVRVVALAESEASIDLLELAGATNVLCLKARLGEHLSHRIHAGGSRINVIGGLRDLTIAELTVHHTALVGLTLREAGVRESTGVNIVGVWERGRLVPVQADLRLSDFHVPVVIGSREQLDTLDALLLSEPKNSAPVLILGGGKVGRAAARALKARGLRVHMVEQNEALRPKLADAADRLVVGNAADRDVLMSAGLMQAPAVILTTNNDNVNIYLSIYCRRLNPDLYIVSRITRERNIEAIHRAGADFVLSYATLGRESIISALQGREPVMLGENVDVFVVRLPSSLEGKTLAESRIGARTGLIVFAIRDAERTLTNPGAAARLSRGDELLMLGTSEQRQLFAERYEGARHVRSPASVSR
jgi:voltage-gated potassium channel